MKRGSTLFLKIALFLIGAPVLVLCTVLIVAMIKEISVYGIHGFSWVIFSLGVIICASTIPFYIALYLAFKLLTYIDKNKAFSQISVTALKKIKQCATIFAGLYVLALPLFYVVAELEDAPGLIVIGMILVFGPTVIAVFAAVLQRLLQEAINYKEENDLTV